MTARKPRPIFARARENLLNGPVAQLVEHLTFNQVVTGSIPVGLTKSLSKNMRLKTTGEYKHWKIGAVSAQCPLQRREPIMATTLPEHPETRTSGARWAVGSAMRVASLPPPRQSPGAGRAAGS